MKRIKIHVDLPNTGENKISICKMDGTVIETCKRLTLNGHWILRQYNNPVPCGATVVLYPEDDTATHTIIH